MEGEAMKQKKLKGLEKLAEINRQLREKRGPFYDKWLRAVLKSIKSEESEKNDG